MQYLLNNKIYDTENSENIRTFIKIIPYETLFNYKAYPKYECTLYKSKKGQFFIHIGKYIKTSSVVEKDKDYIELISINEVKKILNELNDVENFKKLFPEDVEEG